MQILPIILPEKQKGAEGAHSAHTHAVGKLQAEPRSRPSLQVQLAAAAATATHMPLYIYANGLVPIALLRQCRCLSLASAAH